MLCCTGVAVMTLSGGSGDADTATTQRGGLSADPGDDANGENELVFRLGAAFTCCAVRCLQQTFLLLLFPCSSDRFAMC